MIVSPSSAHAAGTDVVGHDVAVVGELFIEDSALAVLGHNLLVHQLLHFRVRTDLAISTWVMGIVYPADSRLALASFSRDRFSATAELRAVNWAKLTSTESHSFPPDWDLALKSD